MRNITQRLKAYYMKEMFQPGLLALFINPFYFARKGLLKSVRQFGTFISGRTLDVGCGQKPYESFFRSSEYVGLEFDGGANEKTSRADVYYRGGAFPFATDSFDSVVVTQVLEHIFQPDYFLVEINRVLKPNGHLFISVPFIWDEHEQPFDFARYSSFGLRSILERSGFKIIQHQKSLDDIRVIFQLINTYIYKKTVTRSILINLLFTFCLMSPFNMLGELFALLLPRNEDLYLDNHILARKTAND